MIKELHFSNFRLLHDVTVPLSDLTLIVGPNSSGKSTVLQGLGAASIGASFDPLYIGTVLPNGHRATPTIVTLTWGRPIEGIQTRYEVNANTSRTTHHYVTEAGKSLTAEDVNPILGAFSRFRAFSLSADEIARPVTLARGIELGANGSGLAGVLDRMRDEDPDLFDQLNEELPQWVPEFDRILFETTEGGQRGLTLRRSRGRSRIRATELSHGSLFALALMTIASDPMTPDIIAIEEPERGIHPRLLMQLRDALLKMTREPKEDVLRRRKQVIVTSHSPYLLDLFRDYPEDIVISTRKGYSVGFKRLSDREDVAEILSSGHLGDIWYSGILGGVPGSR